MSDVNTIINEGEEYILHTYNRFPVVFDHGDGMNLYDVNGKEYLDFVSGIGVFALGYNNKKYNDALKGQIDNAAQTAAVAAMLAPIQKEVSEIKAAQPSTVSVQYPQLTAVPAYMLYGNGYSGYPYYGSGSIWA